MTTVMRLTIRKPLQHIPNIQHQHPVPFRHRGHVLPRPRIPQLQPTTVVLKQERERAPVRVRRQSGHLQRLPVNTINTGIMQQSQLGVPPRLQLHQRRLFFFFRVKTEPDPDGLEDDGRNTRQSLVERGARGPEAGQHGLGQPDVLLKVVVRTSDFVAFLWG